MRAPAFFATLLPLSLLAQTPAKPAIAPKPATLQPAAPKAQDHGPINWVTMEQAQELSKKDGKPIMIDVFTQWCGPCRMLAGKTFTDKQLADYVNKNYHAVRFDAESQGDVTYKGVKYSNPDYKPELQGTRNGTHQLTQVIAPVNGRIAYPTVIYMDSDGNILAPVQGYLTPDQMEPILIYFGEGIYKTKDWESFRSGFTTRRTAE